MECIGSGRVVDHLLEEAMACQKSRGFHSETSTTRVEAAI